jgi:glycosyltransferase involved in cell wall biosynthesis
MSQRAALAIAWSPHAPRAVSYAKWLDIPLFSIHYLMPRRPLIAPIKYMLQWVKTWLILLREHPATIYVQNSPPVAGLCVWLYCRMMGAAYVLDTHSPVLFSRKWGWSRPLVRFLARRAAVNIVDQERFKNLFESWGAKTLLLSFPPSAIPLEAAGANGPSDALELAYVGSFNRDEPVDIILSAAPDLPDVTFYLLGKKEHARREWLVNAPPNVIFTGYLLGDEYWSRLQRSRAIISLTTYPHSLMAGAQEGLYIDKPLILSDQPTLREYFTQGTVFVENTPQAFAAGVKTFIAQENTYQREIAELHHTRAQQWEANFRRLDALVNAGAG